MYLPLSQDGDPCSAFLAALPGRRLALEDQKSGVHPVQAIGPRWRAFGTSLGQLVARIEALNLCIEPDGDEAMEAFRRMLYDTTELFDVYANLLPKGIAPGNAREREAHREFEKASTRLRGPWATICNQCKHQSAQLHFLWGTSDGVSCPRFLVCVYRDGNSLIRDEVVHKKKMGGIGLVRATQELLHALFRIDIRAGKLIDAMADRACDAIPSFAAELPIGACARRAAALPVTIYSDEPVLHDGIVFSANRLELTRVGATRLANPVQVRAKVHIEPLTRHFSIA
jgi:hypothetical protein